MLTKQAEQAMISKQPHGPRIMEAYFKSSEKKHQTKNHSSICFYRIIDIEVIQVDLDISAEAFQPLITKIWNDKDKLI